MATEFFMAMNPPTCTYQEKQVAVIKGKLTEETSQILYGCLWRLKDYEDSGMNPDRISNLKYEVEDKVAYICDKLCRHPWEITEQDELDEVCEECPVNAYVRAFISN